MMTDVAMTDNASLLSRTPSASLRALSPLNGVIIRGNRQTVIAFVISLGQREKRFDEVAIDLPGSDIAKQRRGDDDIIRVGTASALCLHCTPAPGRANAL